MAPDYFKIKAHQHMQHQGETHTQADQRTCQDKNMHTQTKRSLSLVHTHTYRHTLRQRSECWLLPVGLWSLNCLSDSSLSKFTMREPTLCLPELLQLKHTQRKKHTRIHNPKRDRQSKHTNTHTDGNPLQIAAP